MKMININTDDINLKKTFSIADQYINLYSDFNNVINAEKFTDEGYRIKKENDKFTIYYNTINNFYSAYLYLLANYKNIIDEKRKSVFKDSGFMICISAGGVPKLDTLKRFIITLAMMGYNFIQLGIDDCMELDNEPYYGYLRGRYSKNDLKEISSFGEMFGVEIIPCVQVFGHCDLILQHPVYHNILDSKSVLLCDDEKTYSFIDKIIANCRECFKSDKINICFDEAETVGQGVYKRLHGYVPQSEITIKHLNRVIEICEKYNYKPSMWSDMFFKNEFGSYYVSDKEFKKESIEKIPKDIDLIYWDYYSTDESRFDNMIKRHNQLVDLNRIQFAGAVWTFSGFAPLIGYTDESMKQAIKACKKNKLNTFILTIWGDESAECSFNTALSSMIKIGEEFYTDNIDEILVSKKLKVLTNYTAEEWIALEYPNRLFDKYYPTRANPSKYFFYQDPMMGRFDNYVKLTDKAHHENSEVVLNELVKRESNYAYLFEYISKLEKFLKFKETIGVELRSAYRKKDKKLLDNCLRILEKSIDSLNEFYDSFVKVWDKEKKSFGFEAHDARIGGLKQRLKHAYNKLKAYMSGKIDSIEELDADILDYQPWDEDKVEENWARINIASYWQIMTTGRRP